MAPAPRRSDPQASHDMARHRWAMGATHGRNQIGIWILGMAGRPTDYNDEIAEIVCNRIACGESVLGISKDPDMPGQTTIYQWLFRHDAFAVKYARAREAQMDAMADEIQSIADDTEKDTHVTKYGDGTERESPNTEWISRSRLRVDTRKWLMSKLAPKKYADRIVNQMQGHDGGPLTVSWKKEES